MVSLSTRTAANAGCERSTSNEQGSKGLELRLTDGIVVLGEVPRKIFSLAVTWKMRTDNPTTAFRKRPETARERLLSFEKIQRLAEVGTVLLQPVMKIDIEVRSVFSGALVPLVSGLRQLRCRSLSC
ncbi:hypothetical protein [Tabrizicola sp.]|uniref:hypothetical protein n=1 Tax=Tabrizicola sp. TaxID=2005166 RepID=UPI00286BD9A1|nr:hypothetical protein [Tabrizicola sp.]